MRGNTAKRIFTLLLLQLLLFSAIGCAGQENTGDMSAEKETDENEASAAAFAPSDGKVPAASWESTGNESHPASKIIGDTLYFMEGKWNPDSECYTNASIYRRKRGEQEAEKIADLGDSELVIYLVDEAESLYYLYAETSGGITDYFIKKTAADGTVLYDIPVLYQGGAGKQAAFDRLSTAFLGEVDREGAFCLSNTYGDLYVFSSEGQLLCISNAPWDEDSYHGDCCGLVNAGKDGLFTYLTNGKKISLQQINMSDGKLGTEIEVQSDSRINASVSIYLYSGYDMGILVSDSDTLWRYNISDREMTRILNWGDSAINLKDHSINGIGILTDETLYIMAGQSYNNVAFVHIDYREESEVSEKQVITLGMMSHEIIYSSGPATPTELEEMVSAFNRRNTEYQIEISPYASIFDLYTDLLKGTGPDVLSLTDMDIDVLADKGVLENLSPHFTESNAVKEEDLLPSIRNAGTINGELLYVFPTFQIGGYYVEKGTTDKGGWTTEAFIGLAEAHPDAALIDASTYYHSGVLHDALRADYDSYINWQEKECYFDSDRFLSLLERIKNLNAVAVTPVFKNLEEIRTYDWNAPLEKFHQKELLTLTFSCASVVSFMDIRENAGDFAELAGYPSESGEPCYSLLSPSDTVFGINSASGSKEGAWTFLEFLLSEEYQNTIASTRFPVRQDAFDRHLALTEMYNGNVKIDLSDEEKEFIRYMADHAYPVSSISNIYPIISEETEAVWAGDKTAAEAAEIIQGRVTIFLNE